MSGLGAILPVIGPVIGLFNKLVDLLTPLWYQLQIFVKNKQIEGDRTAIEAAFKIKDPQERARKLRELFRS